MKRNVIARCVALLGAVICLPLAAAPPDEPRMRPFVMRWDDTEPSVLDLSFLSPDPAGANGPVLVSDDGYLVTGGERLKLFGVNIGGGTAFADIDDATRDKFAGRMRKFGLNAVRFHHLGATWYETNAFGKLTANRNADTRQFDAENLDRLHRWVAAFREHGIYTNMNLLVSRRFVPEDGLPASIDTIGWKLQGTVAMWHPALIDLQKEYATQLLASDNPHTGVPLAADPSLATVEINNENGILHTWFSGELDDVPADLIEPLRVSWNDWLKEKYADDAAVAEAWGASDQPLGGEMLTGDFAVQAQGGAFANLASDFGLSQIVVQQPGGEAWHVQYLHPGVSFEAGRPYTLTFEAKADSDRSIGVDFRQASDPWQPLGFQKNVELTDDWQTFAFTAVGTMDEDNGRVTFDGLSQPNAVYEFRKVSLRPGGKVGGETTLGEIPIPSQGGETPVTLAQRKDWIAFTMDAERAYFGEMKRFLNDDLGVVAPVVGTIVGTSPMGVQKEMDAIDTHAYWRHPQFPGEPWDPENWIVEPDSMVNFPESSAILGPMLRQVRVDGKRLPHMLTEYDHPAPNPHAGEAPLFAAAYAALQDFDAVYLFTYDVDFDEEPGKITGFFDYANHPTKMANMIPAALIFRRGDVKPAKQEAVVGITEEMELDALVERGAAWSMVDYGAFTDQPLAAIEHRVAVDFAQQAKPAPTLKRKITRYRGPVWFHATPEFPRRRGSIAMIQAVSAGLFGHASSVGFGNEYFLSVKGRRWSTAALTLLEGSQLEAPEPRRALLVATGNYANTGWQWKSDARNSLGTNWGTAPTLIEVVPVTLTLKAEKSAKAWALDAVGRRVEEVAVELNDGVAVIRVGPGHTETATLFYEVEWE